MKEKSNKRKLKFKKDSLLSKLLIVAILLFIVLNILRHAAYFKRDFDEGMMISIQNEINVELAHDIYIDENNVIYLSEEDMKTYLDNELYYEKDESNMRRYISISQNKILEITENKNHMFVNGNREKIKGAVIDKDGVFYFPISELENVYNIKIDYLKEKNRLNIEKMSEEKTVAVVNRNINLKYKMTAISKNIDKLEQGENVTIVEDMGNGWVRIKTADYDVGYVKKSKLTNIEKERYNLGNNDYNDFNFDTAKMVEINDSTYKNFDELISSYDGREKIIKEILNKVSAEITKESVDIGIKVNMVSTSNTDNFYKFLKELRASANNVGVCVIVATQPGLDKDTLGNIVDIVV